MVQKIHLAPNGIVTQKRMQPYTKGQAVHVQAVKLGRLKQLLQTKEPRICIVRGEGAGDVLMTTPTVRAIKNMFENVKIAYATNTSYLDHILVKVLKYNPDIDVILERDLLNDADFDLVINLHCPAIAYEMGDNPPLNRIDIFASHAGVKLQDATPVYVITSEEIEQGYEQVKLFNDRKVILVQPSASNKRRSLSHSKLKQSLIKLNNEHNIGSIVLTHGSDYVSDVIWNNIPGCTVLHNFDIRQIAGVMVHCDLVLCQDSSILHLAGALKVPTVALFGPTHPAARINHYPQAVAIWKGKDLNPCPCWFAACPIGNICWDLITIDDIIEGCVNHIQNTSKPDISVLREQSSMNEMIVTSFV